MSARGWSLGRGEVRGAVLEVSEERLDVPAGDAQLGAIKRSSTPRRISGNTRARAAGAGRAAAVGACSGDGLPRVAKID